MSKETIESLKQDKNLCEGLSIGDEDFIPK